MQALIQPQTSPFTQPVPRGLLHLSVYLFPIVSVVSSIPVFSIVIKYNLLENGFSQRFSFAWSVLFPWAVGLPLLYMPNIVAQVTALFAPPH